MLSAILLFKDHRDSKSGLIHPAQSASSSHPSPQKQKGRIAPALCIPVSE
jgi:hypothetical protein